MYWLEFTIVFFKSPPCPKLCNITTNSIDALYEKGISAGALGGKLLGAGGGGFLVFYVQPGKRESVLRAMKDLLYVPFRFEDGGTQIIHYTPESYIPREGD